MNAKQWYQRRVAITAGVAAGLLARGQTGWPASLEEIGLVNSDLSKLPRDFLRRLPHLSKLRISSGKWHCDKSLIWFRDWMLDPSLHVTVENRPDIRCATPPALHGRLIISLEDSEFVDATTTSPASTTSTRRPSTSSLAPQTTNIFILAKTTRLTRQSKPPHNTALSSSTVLKTNSFPSTEQKMTSKNAVNHPSITVYPTSHKISRPSEDRSTNIRQISTVENFTTSPLRLPNTNPTKKDLGVINRHVKHEEEKDDEDWYLSRFKTRVIVAVATVGATMIIAAFIVAGIIYVCRSRQQKDTSGSPGSGSESNGQPRTFIKYKNKNGVLYFSTPAEPPSTTTVVGPDVGDDAMDDSLRYTLPPPSAGLKTRVYRWEDF